MFTSTYRTFMAILLGVALIVVPVKQAEAFVFFFAKKSMQRSAAKKLTKPAFNKAVTQQASKKIAKKIVNGHAGSKHLKEFQKAGIAKNKSQLKRKAASIIQSGIKNGNKKDLSRGRTVYFEPKNPNKTSSKASMNFLIHDKRSKDGGTMFIGPKKKLNRLK